MNDKRAAPAFTNTVRVQTADFDMATEYQLLCNSADSASAGAVVTFTGLVRDFNRNAEQTPDYHVYTLELEHYPGMTEKVLQDIIQQARTRWTLINVTIVHRVGKLLPADQIVFVGVSSAHRKDAFAAGEFIMDFLKTQAPFWKKEQTPTGEHWVEARTSDTQAAKRWADDCD